MTSQVRNLRCRSIIVVVVPKAKNVTLYCIGTCSSVGYARALCQIGHKFNLSVRDIFIGEKRGHCPPP